MIASDKTHALKKSQTRLKKIACGFFTPFNCKSFMNETLNRSDARSKFVI